MENETYTYEEMLEYAIPEFEKYDITFRIIGKDHLFVIDKFYMQKITHDDSKIFKAGFDFFPHINDSVFGPHDFDFYRKGRQERLRFPFKSDTPIDVKDHIKRIAESFHTQYEIFKGDLRKYIHENTKLDVLKWFKTDNQFEMLRKYVFDAQTNAEAYLITNNEKFLSKEARELFVF